MKNNLKFILALFVAAGLYSCSKPKKDAIELPPVTSFGNNTFGCTINGKVFVSNSLGTPHGGLALSASYVLLSDGYHLTILAPRSTQESNDILSVCRLRVVSEQGKTYNLDKKQAQTGGSGLYSSLGNYYETGSGSTGQLKITRLDNKVVSGTFEFDATAKTGEKVEVRDGRFDIKLQ